MAFAAGITALALYVVADLQTDYQTLTGHEQQSAAQYVARTLDANIRARRGALVALAQHVKDFPDFTPQRLQSYVLGRYAANSLFSNDIYILWKDGSRVAENPARGTLGAHYSGTPYFEAVMRSHAPVVQVILGRFANKPVVVVAVPIFGKDGTVLGALCGTELVEGESFLNVTNTAHNGQTGGFHVFALDQGIYAASTDPSRVLKKQPAPGVNPLFDRRLTGYLEPGRVVDSKGVEVITAAAVAATPNWLVIAYLPTREAFEPLYRATHRIYAGAALVIALVGLLTWLYLRRALLPLERAASQMGSFRSEPFELGPLTVEGSAEIRVLLHNFNVLQTDIVRKNQLILAERDTLDSLVIQRTQELLDLYDQAPCGYHTLSPEGVILRVNKTELALLGYAEDEFLGRNMVEFMTPDSVRTFRKNYPQFLEIGHVRNLEFDFVCKDGSIRPFVVDGDLVRGASGEPLCTRSTMVDNTVRREQTIQINALNRFLQEVLETLPFGVVALDEERNVVLHNRRVIDLLDYPADFFDRSPTTFSDIVRSNHARGDYPGHDVEAVLGQFVHAMRTRKIIKIERQQTNGTYLEISGQPLTNGWTLLTYTDISAHKRTEQTLDLAMQAAEAATIAKSAFITNMSHEIRTPMNAISGLSYLLGESALPAPAQDLVQKMRMASTTLLAILNDVLDYSKIESGKLTIRSAPFRLGDILDRLATIMSINAQDKDLELIIAPTSVGVSRLIDSTALIGDSLRLEQVLTNLTGNAIKFTAHGHVALVISALTEAHDSMTLRFSVTDSGIGIAQEKQQEIFVEFSQADESTNRTYGGSGLGLTISRRLVEAMGGTLNVNSVLGRGSEFWFALTFPCAQNALEATPISAELQPPASVVIVDAHAMARDALCTMAQGLGWRATALGTGDEVLAHLAAGMHSGGADEFVLLDPRLPVKDGLPLVDALRNRPRAGAGTFVIWISTYGSDKLPNQTYADWADAIVTKPVTPSSLHSAVMRARRARQGGALKGAPRIEPRLLGLRMLVVDDSDINREVAQRIFSAEGAQVALATNGQEAIQWLQVHGASTDVVLMDVQMPVLNGYEATQIIRGIPELAQLPIVALTAGAFREQQDQASQAGMTRFISKPFDVDAAVALILQLTRRQDASAPAPPPAPSPAPSPAPLPMPAPPQDAYDLPGIALEKGMAIWRDAAVYKKFLRRFVVEYAQVTSALRTVDNPEALVHKLKGAAGNLALVDVAARSHQLEQLLRNHQDAQQATAQLQAAMDVVLVTIGQFAPEPAVPEGAEIWPEDADAGALPALLQAWDREDIAAVRRALAELGTRVGTVRLQAIQEALDNYDFRAGVVATRALMAVAHQWRDGVSHVNKLA